MVETLQPQPLQPQPQHSSSSSKEEEKEKQLEYLNEEDCLCQLQYTNTPTSKEDSTTNTNTKLDIPTIITPIKNDDVTTIIRILQQKNSILLKDNYKLSLQNTLQRNEMNQVLESKKELLQDLQQLQNLLKQQHSLEDKDKEEVKKLRLELLQKNRQLEMLKKQQQQQQQQHPKKKKKKINELCFSRIIMKHHIKSSFKENSKLVQTELYTKNDGMTQTEWNSNTSVSTQTTIITTNTPVKTKNVYTQYSLVVDESSFNHVYTQTTTSTEQQEEEDTVNNNNIELLVTEFDRERDNLLKQLDDKDEYIHQLMLIQQSNSSSKSSCSDDEYNNILMERDSLVAMVHKLELELEQTTLRKQLEMEQHFNEQFVNQKNIYNEMEQQLLKELHSLKEQLLNRELLVEKLQEDFHIGETIMEDYHTRLKQKEQELKEMERLILEYEVQIDLLKEKNENVGSSSRSRSSGRRDRGCQTDDYEERESVGVQVDFNGKRRNNNNNNNKDRSVNVGDSLLVEDLKREDVGVNTFVVKKIETGVNTCIVKKNDAAVNTSASLSSAPSVKDDDKPNPVAADAVMTPASKSEQRIQLELESTRNELKHYEQLIENKKKINKKTTSEKDGAVVAKEVLKTWKAQNEALRRELLSIVKGNNQESSPSVASSSTTTTVVSKTANNRVGDDETFITVAGDTFKIETSLVSSSTPLMIPSEVSSIKPIVSQTREKTAHKFSFKDEKDDQDFFRRSLDQSERRRLMLEEENKKIMSLVQQVADDLKLAKDVGS